MPDESVSRWGKRACVARGLFTSPENRVHQSSAQLFWLSVFYGMTFKVVFLASIPKEAINFPIEVFLIYSVVQILNRIRPL